MERDGLPSNSFAALSEFEDADELSEALSADIESRRRGKARAEEDEDTAASSPGAPLRQPLVWIDLEMTGAR
jgi:hypothetical protein